MRPTSLRFFTICMILFLMLSVTLYLGTRTPSVRDPLASAETTDYPSPSSSPDSSYRKAGGALLHRLRREVGVILGEDIYNDGSSRENGDGREREQVSLMHVRGVIPTQYYMRKRSALSPIITQAVAQVTSTRRKEGEPQLMATSSPIVDVSIVDVAYAGISTMKDDNDEGTKKAADKGVVLLDSLEWSIGKKLLTEKQRNNFMSMNPDDTIWSPTLANVLQAAHRHQEGLDNADGAFVLYTGPLVTFGADFYKVIGNILSNSSINSIAFRSGQNQDWLGFVFPVAWIPYLQFAGVLIDGPSKPIGELFCYNLEILSKGMGRFVRKNYQAIHLLSDEDALVSDHTSQLAAAWQQIQSADAYWALHPNQMFPKYSKGLEPRRFCPCGNQKDSCPHDLERYFDTDRLAQELHRACLMAEAMLKDNTEKAPFKISAELHPSFAFGDFRDFRNLDSCSEKFAGFRKGLPKVGFVSYPRSGNTWTRRILERATSVLTGAVYDDQLLKDGGLLGEGRMNDVLMVKDHWPFDFSGGKKVLGWAEKIVWIVRNPFKSIESYYHYFYSGYRHSVSSSIDRQKWREWVTKESKAWVDWQKKWLSIAEENKVPILRVSYENLVDNPVDEVRRILEFIDFEVNEEKIGCAVQTNCKVNCRVGKNATAAVDIYGPEETEIMMKNIGDFMKQFGYEGKPVKKKR